MNASSESLYCQVCGLANPLEQEFCSRCQSKLLVLSGVGSADEQEEEDSIPLDEHLLERISALEEVVKRSGDAIRLLFENFSRLEKNLFIAQTGVRALQETLERAGQIRSEEMLDLWETKMDERMRAVEKRERFLDRRDRILAGFTGGERESFLKSLREAEFAILSLDAERGIRLIEQAYRLDRGNVELAFYLAETYFSEGDLERASSFLKRLLGVDPEHFEGLLYSGIVASEMGDEAAAETALIESIARKPDSFLPHFALGTLFARQSRWDDAEHELRRALEVGSVAAAHTLLGSIYRERGETQKAISEFEKAISLDRTSEDAVFQLGLCYLDRNANRRALACFQEALEINPKKLEYQEAVRLLENRRMYSLPVVSGPGAEAYHEAEQRVAEGRLRHAAELYRRAMAADPANATIKISYALLATSLGLTRESIKACREVLAAGPEEMIAAAACSTLAEALRSEGKSGDANRAVRDFLEKYDSDTARAVGYYELATNLAETGENLDEALDLAGKALAAAPEELKPYPLAALGWVHYKRQEFDRAIDCLRRSSEKAPAPSTLNHLGMAYLAAGRADEAKSAFKKAKTVAARGAAIEERMLEQVRSNLRMIEKAASKAPRPRGK